MIHYFAFLKKELLESIRTYKFIILLVVFAMFGIMSPLTAKLIPALFKTFIPYAESVLIPEPRALDSWAQFFKNVSQMGLIVFILMYSSVVSGELAKKTLVNMLTKGLSRKAVILSKFTNMVIIWFLSILSSSFITWGYTVYLFPNDKVSYLVFSIFCLWLFGVFLLSLLVFASTLTTQSYISLIILVGSIVISMLLNIIPSIQKYNPLTLSTKNLELLQDFVNPSYFKFIIPITLTFIIIFLISSILIFRKKEIR